ncbi:hypothetical protein KEM52_006433 [Ascosphaera acerosa]|nr:hypothetical protein KEM52_006433 [Ascosphaera acerosa]
MEDWLAGPGQAYKHPSPTGTNYVTAFGNEEAKPAGETAGGDAAAAAQSADGSSPATSGASQSLRPFPLNPAFVSQPILSEQLRNTIYEKVVVEGKSVRAVSVMYGVDMRRVAAVVRLCELEQRWIAEGKPLAKPYARAVHQMVPTTPLRDAPVPHETINDLPVHPLTGPQIFYPASESRRFTRRDAGRVFSAAPSLVWSDPRAQEPHNSSAAIARATLSHGTIEKVGKRDNRADVLLPADVRIPHPHLVAHQYDTRNNTDGDLFKLTRLFEQRIAAQDKGDLARKMRRKAAAEAVTTHVLPPDSRFEFRFRDVKVERESIGPKGRGRGVGSHVYLGGGVPVLRWHLASGIWRLKASSRVQRARRAGRVGRDGSEAHPHASVAEQGRAGQGISSYIAASRGMNRHGNGGAMLRCLPTWGSGVAA